MISNNWDDKAMVNAIQSGDRKAFSRIVESYYDDVYWYAKSLSRDEALAKDMVQEAFLKLWKKRKKVKEGTVIKGWLYKSVKNNFLDYIKKYKRETRFLEITYLETLDFIVSKENETDLKRKVGIIEKEIEQLPNKCNKVFNLSKKEGLTNNEIADYLGISIKTVEGHLTKALKILRKKLKEKIQILFLI
tara:strand:+ start:112 stop:681 length:570 start_codon:yes stop_codon:yes gene_type:complete